MENNRGKNSFAGIRMAANVPEWFANGREWMRMGMARNRWEWMGMPGMDENGNGLESMGMDANAGNGLESMGMDANAGNG